MAAPFMFSLLLHPSSWAAVLSCHFRLAPNARSVWSGTSFDTNDLGSEARTVFFAMLFKRGVINSTIFPT